eukprot:CAMPEP_0113953288 /NCGR_PEP_ID=MMETSP1339-20121228/90898_1 /TAXON_ID=94617 /ORGANISM="Fibrocapsa japonica" /LENGTH=143 /DNA_ID=CAMNT_0000962011 /DNA_START=424 /DNA_END=855 /DNA_ORIENTATION=- /assembly_acc=CAM_ASM_000762
MPDSDDGLSAAFGSANASATGSGTASGASSNSEILSVVSLRLDSSETMGPTASPPSLLEERSPLFLEEGSAFLMGDGLSEVDLINCSKFFCMERVSNDKDLIKEGFCFASLEPGLGLAFPRRLTLLFNWGLNEGLRITVDDSF